MTLYEKYTEKKELALRKARRATDATQKNFFIRVAQFCENKCRCMTIEEACSSVN